MDTQRICVVLAVHNGAKHLSQQLQSYRDQTLPPTWVVAGDDGSIDGSVEILQAFFDDWPDCTLILRQGPCRGYAANFMHLITQVPRDADLVAFSDQDDLWLPDKLARGAAALAESPDEVPALYGAATWVCDTDLQNRRLSRLTTIPTSFAHALTQNFAGGNTMMLNAAGLHLLQSALPRISDIPVHDWWVYQVVTGAGGRASFDTTPCLLYRQHAANQIGANDGPGAMLRRLREMIRGTYRLWNTANLTALDTCGDLLSPDARQSVADLLAARHLGPLARLGALRRLGLHRQGAIGQTGLWVSMLLNRF